jgi:hypothetical protein
MTIGIVRLIAGVVGLAIFGSIIWLSVRARPLGNKPYRWAKYIAITTGMAALVWGPSLIAAVKNVGLAGVILAVTLIAACVVCSFGLLRRRRYGVVMFHVAYILIWITHALLAGIYGTHPTLEQSSRSAMFLLYYLVTAVYLGKRWRWLAAPV